MERPDGGSHQAQAGTEASPSERETALSADQASIATEAAEQRRDIAASVALVTLGMAVALTAQWLVHARRRARLQ